MCNILSLIYFQLHAKAHFYWCAIKYALLGLVRKKLTFCITVLLYLLENRHHDVKILTENAWVYLWSAFIYFSMFSPQWRSSLNRRRLKSWRKWWQLCKLLFLFTSLKCNVIPHFALFIQRHLYLKFYFKGRGRSKQT